MAAVKGCDDYYPQDYAVREAVFSVLRKAAASYGFEEVSTPAMETVELLTKKSGDEIKEQLFVLEKRSNEQLALRFDLTVPITRIFMQRQLELAKPVKWFGLDRMWRYEAPQKGRNREFYQLSVELFGSDKPEADAEVINLAISCLKAFGISAADVRVRINNRKLLEGMVRGITGSDAESVVRVIDKKNKITPQQFVDELFDCGLDQEQADRIAQLCELSGDVLSQLRKMNLSDEAKKGLAELEAVLSMLPKDWVEVDISLARGLAYYSGTVFEVFDRKGELRAIAGGGRYDNLVELFGGSPEPATGFGMGYSTLSLLLQKLGKMPKAAAGMD